MDTLEFKNSDEFAMISEIVWEKLIELHYKIIAKIEIDEVCDGDIDDWQTLFPVYLRLHDFKEDSKEAELAKDKIIWCAKERLERNKRQRA